MDLDCSLRLEARHALGNVSHSILCSGYTKACRLFALGHVSQHSNQPASNLTCSLVVHRACKPTAGLLKIMSCAYLQANAEEAVREMLAEFSREQQLPEVGTVTAQDHMDDGTSICLAVRPCAIASHVRWHGILHRTCSSLLWG